MSLLSIVMNGGRARRNGHLTVVDLFSGPGGMSQGIKDARNCGSRFDVVAANDYDRAVQATYMKNHRSVRFVHGSITEEATKESIISAVVEQTGSSTVDLVVGGPPCKGFSLENKMTRSMENPMNRLVMHYVEMIRRLRPTAFIMENVPGIFAMQRGMMIRSLMKSFRDLRYLNTTAWLLDASDYGVPQSRRRAFVVGSKGIMPINAPERTHGERTESGESPRLLERVCLADAISDLPAIASGRTSPLTSEYATEPRNDFQRRMRRRSTRVKNHIVTKNSPLVTKRMQFVPPGGNWRNIPVEMMQVEGRYSRLGPHSQHDLQEAP